MLMVSFTKEMIRVLSGTQILLGLFCMPKHLNMANIFLITDSYPRFPSRSVKIFKKLKFYYLKAYDSYYVYHNIG